MHPSVAAAFRGFITNFEGNIPHMYLDSKGLVTVGIGNLIDSPNQAARLPFVRKEDQQPADEAEIRAEWESIKAHQELASAGARAFAELTSLMLTPDAIAQLLDEVLHENERHLKRSTDFSDLDTWPADAQLALLGMAWALGPGFGFPSFRAACSRADFLTAAEQCNIRNEERRNRVHQLLLRNAAAVVAVDLPREVLIFPTIMMQPVDIFGDPDAPEPEPAPEPAPDENSELDPR